MAAGAGDGGAVRIDARRLVLADRGLITTETVGPGRAGSIDITARNLSLARQAIVASDSSGTGPAGAVIVDVTGQLSLSHSGITTAAPDSSGGGIDARASRRIDILDSSVTAEAGGEGGNLRLLSRGAIGLFNSTLLSQAGGNGGNIMVDPSAVALGNTRVSADGGVNGGNISILPDALVKDTASSITATGILGVSGNISLTNPNPQLVNALVPLPTAFETAQLQPQCGARFLGTDISSFIQTGRGGAPPEPGGWLPDTESTGSRPWQKVPSNSAPEPRRAAPDPRR